ncbi:hypothetical protein M2165_002644 [Variovorax sp. TBS-050B]|nr:hypothetical protein [Variovorax sp. TBS-050B]
MPSGGFTPEGAVSTMRAPAGSRWRTQETHDDSPQARLARRAGAPPAGGVEPQARALARTGARRRLRPAHARCRGAAAGRELAGGGRRGRPLHAERGLRQRRPRAYPACDLADPAADADPVLGREHRDDHAQHRGGRGRAHAARPDRRRWRAAQLLRNRRRDDRRPPLRRRARPDGAAADLLDGRHAARRAARRPADVRHALALERVRRRHRQPGPHDRGRRHPRRQRPERPRHHAAHPRPLARRTWARAIRSATSSGSRRCPRAPTASSSARRLSEGDATIALP